MKNRNIIKVTERNITKTLDVLSCYPDAHNGQIIIDDNLYIALPFMSKDQTNQTLNAMSSRNLISIYKSPPYDNGYLKLTDNAFVYKLDNKHKRFKFWFPVITSLISLVCSLRYEFLHIFEWLTDLISSLK